jgi:hypothetical protein
MEKNSTTLGTSSSYVASTLSEDSKFFVVNYMPNTLVGSFNANISKLIKLNGNLALPRKPSHPRRLLRGAPPQNGPIFFAKIRKCANYASNLSLRQVQAEREQPSRKDARDGDSLRLQQYMALLPRLWTSGSLVKSKLST